LRFLASSFCYERFYCCQYVLKEKNEADFTPQIDSFSLKIVSSKHDLEKLAREGFEFGAYRGVVTGWLDKGAIGFCVFVGSELGHMAYVAMTEASKTSLEPPYEVDYSKNEACTGGAFTVPKHRGLGLFNYNYYHMLKFLKERGITTVRNVVARNNAASKKVISKFDTEIYAEACYLGIFRWKLWKEKDLR